MQGAVEHFRKMPKLGRNKRDCDEKYNTLWAKISYCEQKCKLECLVCKINFLKEINRKDHID